MRHAIARARSLPTARHTAEACVGLAPLVAIAFASLDGAVLYSAGELLKTLFSVR